MTDSAQDAPEAAPAGKPRNALTVPAFRNLWFNNVAFFMASNAQRFVFGWFVLDGLDGTESDQGLVVFTLGLPSIFLLLHAGVWADRWDRKRMLVATQLASAATMGAGMIIVDSDNASLGWLIALSIGAGTAAAIGQPVRQALVPALVHPTQLFSAIAVNAIAATLSLILGSALARLFGNIWGFVGAFGFLFGLFILGIVALVPLKVPPHQELPPKRAIRLEILDATRHITHDRALSKLFGLLIVAGLSINPLFMISMQAFVKEDLGRNSGDTALPFALMGVGIAVSSVIVMRKGDMKNKGAAFMRAMMTGTLLVALMGRTTSLAQLSFLSLLMGGAGGFFINMNQGLIQANTPPEIMGRVMSLYTFVQNALTPIGGLLLALLASQIGVGNTMTAVAPIGFLYVLIVYVTDAELRQLS